jgi:hypothetical protein
MKQLRFMELTSYDDGSKVWIVPSQVFTIRLRKEGGCYVISGAGTPLPVRETPEVIRQEYQKAVAEESQG